MKPVYCDNQTASTWACRVVFWSQGRLPGINWQVAVLLRATAPPLSIRNGCFRI